MSIRNRMRNTAIKNCIRIWNQNQIRKWILMNANPESDLEIIFENKYQTEIDIIENGTFMMQNLFSIRQFCVNVIEILDSKFTFLWLVLQHKSFWLKYKLVFSVIRNWIKKPIGIRIRNKNRKWIRNRISSRIRNIMRDKT